MTRFLILALACFTVACGSTVPAERISPVAELAAYDGADRLQRLIEGAKREGELTVYTSAQSTDLGPVLAIALPQRWGGTPAEGGSARHPDQFLGRRIEIGDGAIRPEHDHPIGQRPEHRAQPALAVLQAGRIARAPRFAARVKQQDDSRDDRQRERGQARHDRGRVPVHG